MALDKDFHHCNLPLNEMYVAYCLNSNTISEKDKLQYWPQQKKLFDLLKPLIKNWKIKKMNSSQSLERTYVRGGTTYTTGKNAPVGGLQNYSLDNIEKVSTKYLNKIIEEKTICSNETKQDQFYVSFDFTSIMCSKNKFSVDKSAHMEDAPFDIFIKIKHETIFIYMIKDLMSLNEMNDFVKLIGELACSENIWRAESAFRGEMYTDERGYRMCKFFITDEIRNAINGKNRWGDEWIDILNK